MFVTLLCATSAVHLVSGLNVKTRRDDGGPGVDADFHRNGEFDMEGIITGVYGDNEANPVCQDYQASPMVFQSLTVDHGVTSKERAGYARHQAVHAMVDIAANLKKYCIGASWDGEMCLASADFLRRTSWEHLLRHTHKYSEFDHLRSNTSAPSIKTFRGGGGLEVEVPCRSDGKTAQLFYRHIYKCAGMNIKKNLATDAGMWWGRAVDRDWRVNDRCHEYESSRRSVLFTFVRDPIAKFVAGYKEIASRGLIDTMQGAKVGTRAHALAFLDNVFHGTCDNGHVLLQAQSLIGPACESKFDFIGRLENFEHDWRKVGKMGGCDMSDPLGWNHTMSHASDDTDHGAEKVMQELLEENNGALMVSLCYWVLPDIVIFGYSLPPACAQNKMLQSLHSKSV